nr:MAG TPA: hypothetical protein [Bacteriophage sp.]
MIDLQVFLFGLLVVSTLTGLVTEAVKKMLGDYNKPYRANTLAGVIALILSLCIGIGYVLMNSVAFSTQTIITIIALVFMSWLCAMVGYDKVIQTIGQFKTSGKDD